MSFRSMVKNCIPYGIINYMNTKNVLTNGAFMTQYNLVKNEIADDRFLVSDSDLYPCMNDATDATSFDSHYIYHPAWASRLLYKYKPSKHIDISSSLSFVSQVSTFIPTEFYDFRPADLHLPGLTCKQADVTKLPFTDSSIESISCMHVIEHIGLGRYGDIIDGKGDLKAIAELKRVVMQGGLIYFVVPMGAVDRIQFNAHRIYSFHTIKGYFHNYTLLNFSLVNDKSEYIENASIEDCFDLRYGCGCFLWKKDA